MVWWSQTCSYSSYCNSSVNIDTLSFHIGIKSTPEFWREFCLHIIDGISPNAPNCLTQCSSIICVFVCAFICLECCGQNDPCTNTAVLSYFCKLSPCRRQLCTWIDSDARRGTAVLYPELCCCCVPGWTAWPPEGISHSVIGCGMESWNCTQVLGGACSYRLEFFVWLATAFLPDLYGWLSWFSCLPLLLSFPLGL